MSKFLQLLRQSLSELHLTGRSLLLAVSGGADSIAMLRGMLELRGEFDLSLQVAHLNHQLRGTDSDQDSEWLQTICRQFEIPLTIGEQDIAAIAKQRSAGIEETSRKLRYEFLQEAATQAGCANIATAHTADDQAETILHHILRGTGIAGLTGIPRVRTLETSTTVVRPLLEISRELIVEFLSQLGQDFRTDATNADESYTRNRIRKSLLPLLSHEYNPQVFEALRRLGQQADEVQSLVENVARAKLAEAIEDRQKQICRLNCECLANQPRHLIRECFRLLWKDLDWPRQQMGFAEWDRLVELVRGEGTVSLPGGVEVRRRGSLIILQR